LSVNIDSVDLTKGGLNLTSSMEIYNPNAFDIYIDDIFVQTSFRNKKIATDVTIVNSDDSEHTVTLLGRIEDNGIHELTIGSQQLTIPEGETRTVSLEKNWQNPQLWSPENPHLYHCIMELSEDSQVINDKKVRFGFRELWIEDNHFKLNIKFQTIPQG